MGQVKAVVRRHVEFDALVVVRDGEAGVQPGVGDMKGIVDPAGEQAGQAGLLLVRVEGQAQRGRDFAFAAVPDAALVSSVRRPRPCRRPCRRAAASSAVATA